MKGRRRTVDRKKGMERKKRKEGDGGDDEERERARSAARSHTEVRREGGM